MLIRWYPYQAEAAVAEAPPASGGEGSPAPTPDTTASPSPARDDQGRFVAQAPAATPEHAALSPLDWRSDLEADFQKAPMVVEAKSKNAFVKRALETQRFVGESLRLPKDYDGTKPPEGDMMAATWKRWGRPDSATEYTITAPPEMPDGLAWSPELETQFREEAHAAGLAQWQVERLLAFDARRWQGITNRMEAARAERAAAIEQELATMFGASKPRMLEAASKVWEHLGNGVWGGEAGTRAQQKLADAGLHHDPDVVSAFANLFERMGEARYLVSESYPAGVQGLADVDKELQALTAKEFSSGLSDTEKAHKRQLYELKARLQAAR